MYRIRKKSIEQFQGAYLAIISVVQGTALAFLVHKVFGEQAITDVCTKSWLLSALMLLVLILTWHEYFIGTTAFPYVPTLFDSVFPFGLGVIEFLMISIIPNEDNRTWFLWMGLFFFLAFFGYLNMYVRAKKETQNYDVFKKLGNLINITLWTTIPISIIFFILYYVAKDYFTLAFSVALVVLVLDYFRVHIYWSRLTSSNT